MDIDFDIVVIGAGHAGCEAALAGSRLGKKTLLLTGNIDNIAHMSCNPSIGGLGKGHLVREIDALGGEMGINADETGIQFRKLNTKKGAAVQGTRAQADMYLYKTRLRYVLECQSCLTIKQGIVKKLNFNNFESISVEFQSGEIFVSRAVVITTGTFLRGLCHIGMTNFPGGRAGDAPANELTQSLIDAGFEILRLKTGTVPRLDGRTVAWNLLEKQYSDEPLPQFSFIKTTQRQRQVPCAITYTNSHTHEIILRDLNQSPLFQGVIKGVGPRYCPSIEDKIHRFKDKERHQIFLEPEGLMTNEIYPAGLSTSLPLKTQVDFLRTIGGLEKVEVTRPGYAVEYDAVNPKDLTLSLMSKNIPGLFLAGQINGTSGYEEAAAQGIVAGINAARFCSDLDPVVFSRNESYIGVLVDDLVTKGVGGEPYRMFTSRAENRLHLREDNADLRLTPLGRKIGLVDDARYEQFENRNSRRQSLKKYFLSSKVHASSPALQKLFTDQPERTPSISPSLADLVKKPFIELDDFISCVADEYSTYLNNETDRSVIQTVFSDIKYEGYINRQNRSISEMKNYDKVRLPLEFDYGIIPSLSTEVKQKLSIHRPETLGQALRIPGITPAAINHIYVYIRTTLHGNNSQ